MLIQSFIVLPPIRSLWLIVCGNLETQTERNQSDELGLRKSLQGSGKKDGTENKTGQNYCKSHQKVRNSNIINFYGQR